MSKLKTGYVAKSGNVITPEARASFVYLFKPQKNKNEPEKEPQYGITLLFDKEADLTLLKQAAYNAAVAKFGEAKMKNEAFAKSLRSPFRDQGDFPDYEGYVAGNKFIRATAKLEFKPGVVDANNNDIIEPREVYSGCYGVAAVVAYAYEAKGNKGVAFGLRHVQKTRDGEPIGGGGSSNPSDDFEAVGGGAPAANKPSSGAGSVFD